MGRSVLLIEDSDDHAELIRRALKLSAQPHQLVRLEDGEQALRYLITAADAELNRAKCALILLDLRLRYRLRKRRARLRRQATRPEIFPGASDRPDEVLAHLEQDSSRALSGRRVIS